MMKNVFYNSSKASDPAISASTFSNPIKRHFNIQNQTGSYGVELIWRIFNAVRYQDNEECSVFYFEKKIADKLHKPRRRDTVCECLRKDFQNLSNFKHPKLLKIIHPLEETSESIAFATEKVLCSLANLLGNHARLDVQSVKDIETVEMNEFNRKHGIYQIIEALRYLNMSHQCTHNNCSPYNILITPQNGWKLAGMGFVHKYSSNQTTVANSLAWNSKLPKMAQPNLDYIAPEIQLESNICETSDMFSLGLVICSIYTKTCSSLINSRNTPSIYMERINRLSLEFKDVQESLPDELVKPIEKMLSLDIKYRPNTQLFSLLKYFNDPVLFTLESLMKLQHHDTEKRIETLTNMKSLIDKIPHDILFKTVFKMLISNIHQSESDEFKVVIELLSDIARLSSLHSFDEYLCYDLMDFLKSVNTFEEKLNCIPLVDALADKMTEDSIRNVLLPFVFKDVETAATDDKIAFFDALETHKEFTSKSFIIIRIVELLTKFYQRDANFTVLESMLRCISAVIDTISIEVIDKKILPFLTNIKYDNSNILMASLNLQKQLLIQRPETVDCQLIACSLMQRLVPETVNRHLKIAEFKLLMEILHTMLDRIDKDYWRTHSSPNRIMEDTEDSPKQVPRIQMPECMISGVAYGEYQNYGRRHSQEPIFNLSSVKTMDTPSSDSTSFSTLIQPPNNISAKSSPVTPVLYSKQDNRNMKIASATSPKLDNCASLNVPLNAGRRHSFGSTTLIQTSTEMITASICEGPFFGSPNQPSNLYSGSRRPSTSFINPVLGPNSSKKGSTDNLTVIPIARRSSFNALSDTVMNLFHS